MVRTSGRPDGLYLQPLLSPLLISCSSWRRLLNVSALRIPARRRRLQFVLIRRRTATHRALRSLVTIASSRRSLLTMEPFVGSQMWCCAVAHAAVKVDYDTIPKQPPYVVIGSLLLYLPPSTINKGTCSSTCMCRTLYPRSDWDDKLIASSSEAYAHYAKKRNKELAQQIEEKKDQTNAHYRWE